MDFASMKNPKVAIMSLMDAGGDAGQSTQADAPLSLMSMPAASAALVPSLMSLPGQMPLSLMTSGKVGIPGSAFVKSPSGSIDWGTIPANVEAESGGALKALPIRVQQGAYDQFGMAHVSADKLRRLQRLGFSGLDDYLDHVANNFNLAVQQPNGRIGLVVSPGRGMRSSNDPAHNFMAIELQDNGGHYGMTTIVPDAKSNYLTSGGKEQIWKQGAEPAD